MVALRGKHLSVSQANPDANAVIGLTCAPDGPGLMAMGGSVSFYTGLYSETDNGGQ
jgi:hypothetical protein